MRLRASSPLCGTLVLLSLLAPIACKRKQPPQPPPSPGDKAAPAAADKRTAPADEAKQDRADIDAFFAAWLAAQNQGQWGKYQALYADRFYGVRRSGPRVRRFDRVGWLKDRERMFKKPMTVALDDRKVTGAGGVWNVVGTQTWASGNYKDKGTKRFLLVRQSGRLLIAQEEMLASTIDRPLPPVGEDYLLVYEGEPVVTDRADDGWADGGALRLDGYSARRGVDAKALPEEVRRWHGQDLVLLDPTGRRCEAKAKGFAIVAGANWHFGTIQTWQEGNTGKEAMAEEIWQQGAHRLVVTLETAAGTEAKVCERAVLAVPVSRAPAQVFSFVELNGTPAEDQVLRATRKQLLASVGGKTEELDGEEFHYVAFEDEARSRGIAYSHHYPRECGEESGSASGTYLWRYDEKAKPRLSLLATLEGEHIPSTPYLALDLDGDGELEIVYAGAYSLVAGLLKRSGNTYESVRTVEVPFFDCPC